MPGDPNVFVPSSPEKADEERPAFEAELIRHRQEAHEALEAALDAARAASQEGGE